MFAIIHQLMDSAPKSIVYKSLEVLAKITVPVQGESGQRSMTSPSVVAAIANPTRVSDDTKGDDGSSDAKARRSPMNESNISYAFDILEPERRAMMSRNREVFSALIDLYSCNMSLMDDLSSVLAYMCRLQPSEFVFVSFAVELDKFISSKVMPKPSTSSTSPMAPASDLRFVSSFVQNLNHVLLNKPEAKPMRDALRDCVRFPKAGPTLDERARQRSRLFHIMLHSFAHNLAATISLCIWAGAYRTTSLFLNNSDPLDINLMFLLEVDRFIEHLERPLFRYVISRPPVYWCNGTLTDRHDAHSINACSRSTESQRHLHVRMLEVDVDPDDEGSGSMLFKALKALLMMLPQSTCYHILKDRLVSVSRFRQSSFAARARPIKSPLSKTTASNSSGIVTAATARIAGAAKLSSSAANLPGSLGSINTVGGNGASLGPDIGGAGGIYLSRVLDVRALHCETAWRTIRSESLVVRADPAVDESDENYGTKASSRRDWLGYASEAEEAKAHEARRHQLKSSLGRESDVQPQKYSDLSTLATTDALGGADEAKDSAAEESHGALRPDSEPCQDENCEWKTYWEGSAVS